MKGRLTATERELMKVIIWLYEKLLGHMSGSGSTEEEDQRMSKIKKLLEEVKV